MPLICVCGRSGSGKSRAIAAAMQQAIDQGRNAFLLVPDQFTLDAEHLLMEYMHSDGLMQAEVLSFSRLSARVLEQCGQPKGGLLDARGRAMMVSRVLMERQSDLMAYPRYVHSPHFSSALSGQIAEFKRFDISADQILTISQDHPRLHDIGLIFKAYQASMQGIYTDNEDRINWMIERIPQAPFLQGASVFIDEFEMLTQQVYRIVQAMLQSTHEVYATFRLCCETDADKPLFALEQKHYLRMCRIAEDLGDTVRTIWLPKAGVSVRHRENSALFHLERSLFAQPTPALREDSTGVQLFTAPTMQKETMECARRILSLVREKGYRFRDIAVVASDLSDYGPLLQQAFLSFDIPSFLDVKRSVGTHPLARYALLSLRLLLNNFASRDVLSLIKTGLSSLTHQQADEFEELILTSGIRYLSLDNMKNYAQGYPKLVEYRHTLCAHDELLVSLKAEKEASAQAQLLLSFLEKDGLLERLNERLQLLEDEGDTDAAMELRQVFSVLCSLLSQMGTVMGSSMLTLRAFYDQLNAGLFTQEVGVLPQVRDAVQVGTVGRSRSGNIRALFVLGFNEGKIPRTVSDSGLLMQEDEQLFAHSSLFLGNSLHERLTEEKMALYALLSKPSERLVLSYPQSDIQGSQLLPSSLVHSLRRCFLNLLLETMDSSPLADIQTNASTMLPLAQAIRYARLLQIPLDPAYEKALSLLCPHLPEAVRDWLANPLPEEVDIGEGLAAKAYPDVVSGSATSLETMARCPFSHFATYALLQPAPIKPYGHTPADTGTYFHNLVDTYLQRLCSLDIPLYEFDRQQSDKLLDELCGDYDEQTFLTGIYRKDGRERHLAHSHRLRLKNDCWQLKKQLQRDGFHPVAMESSFERRLTLKDGRQAKVSGRIDRVDTATYNGKRLVRVIDYKTGATSFSFTDLYYGTALQLPLYSVMAASKVNGVSVGMFMQQMRKSIGLCAPYDAEKEREKAAKLNGTFTGECLEATGGSAGDILIGTDKSGRILTEKEYARTLSHGYSRSVALMQQRVDGVVKPSPLKGAVDGCEYCEYSSACGYDMQRGQGRPCRKMDRGDFLLTIAQQEERP